MERQRCSHHISAEKPSVMFRPIMPWGLLPLLSLTLCTRDLELIAVSWLCCCFPASAYPFSKPEWPPHGFLPSKLALMSLLRSLPWPSQTGVGSLPWAAPHPVITVTTSSCNLIPAHFPPSMVNVSRQRNVTCQVDTMFHLRVLRRSCPHQKEHR